MGRKRTTTPATLVRTTGANKRTPERQLAIVNALTAGNTRRAAAAFAEIDQNTFYRWLDDDAEFKAAVENAEAKAEVRFVTRVAQAVAEGDWHAAAWWLERRRPTDYGRRDRVEMTVDIRRAAEALAADDGLDVDEVIAEAERLVAAAGMAKPGDGS
jgi:hypothetical protein